MNFDELTSRVTTAVGPAAAPAVVLRQAVDELAGALRAGERVELLGLVRAHLTTDALLGRTAVEPAEASPREAVVILAVAKTDRFSQIFTTRMAALGRKIHVAEGVPGLMEIVKEYGGDVVIMDSDLEMSDEIRQWLKSSPERSFISLTVLYQREETLDAVDRFRICEDEFLVEPYELETLEQLIQEELARTRAERKYFRHEVSFQFPAHPRFQQQAADFMEMLATHSDLPPESQMGLVVAFREAVDNAIRHGGNKAKSSLVTVAYVVDREKVTVTIEDEGPGFDSTIYLEQRVSGDAVKTARARHREGRQGGLGIMLMLKSVDRLDYNRQGNLAKLTKYLLVPAAAG